MFGHNGDHCSPFLNAIVLSDKHLKKCCVENIFFTQRYIDISTFTRNYRPEDVMLLNFSNKPQLLILYVDPKFSTNICALI